MELFSSFRRVRTPAIVVVALMLASSPAWAQISLVRVTGCGGGAFPGTTCTIPATGNGNLIVVGWDMITPQTGSTITSITDNAGNVYFEAGAAKSFYALASLDIWYAKNSTPGATAITINTSAAVSSAGAVIWEFSGMDPAAPLDVTTVFNNQPSTATPSSPSVTTTASNEVIIAIADVSNSTAGMTAGNPFTSDASIFANGFAHLITASPGTYFAQWNENPAGIYASSAVSFKAASGTGGTPLNACDLAPPFGTINSADASLAVNMALGTAACTAQVEGSNVCTVLTVQRVINASQGQSCLIYNASGPPVITSLANANGTAGSALSYQILATNSPTSYGATGLPAGLSINTGTGLIFGTPAASGTSIVTISATNTGGTGTAFLALTIAAAGATPVITSSNSANVTISTAFTYQITATGSPSSYGASGLPPGLSINAVTGMISGTPTGSGAFSITLSATNSAGSSSATLSLSVNHIVTLNWVPSTSQSVIGYNIYRGTTPGGPYGPQPVNSGLVSGTTFVDNAVQKGQTYYYVGTAVDVTGNESGYSNQAIVTVPST